MPAPVLTAEQLIVWVDHTAIHWCDLFRERPDALALPSDIMECGNVGGLMQHIVAAQLRYAERLSGLPISDYKDIPFDSADALFATHRRSLEMMRALLASPIDWEERITFATRSRGDFSASRRGVLFHALLHAIRHYAQLATLLRHHGIKSTFGGDYLFEEAAHE